jgi:opacity protein-like surface antigen
MTPHSILKIFAIAMLLVLTTSLAQAYEWSGHIGVLAGGKILNNSDWPDLDKHYSLGVISDVKEDSWPISMALDLMDTGGKHDHGGMEDLGHSTEIHLGVRKIFMNQKSKIQPYIGGGVAFMSAELEYETDTGETKEDDSAVGGWLGVGAYYAVHPRFVLGLDVRYSHGEVSLFDQDRDAGGIHAYITAGFQF